MIINYYLDTDRYFRSSLHLFLDLFEHTGKCISPNGTMCRFETAAAEQTFRREHEDAGFFFKEKPQWLYQYFNTEYGQEQVFAVVFGAWYGLHQKACHLIGNKNWRRLSWRILNAFLCGMAYDEIDAILKDKGKTIIQKKSVLEQVDYTGTYFIFRDDEKILAVREQNFLVSSDGQRFQVFYEEEI